MNYSTALTHSKQFLGARCTSNRNSQCSQFKSLPKAATRQTRFHSINNVAAPPELEPKDAAIDPNDRFTQKEWDSYASTYTSQYEEHQFFVEDSWIEGEIPKQLQGTLFRNGPALYEIGGQKINQPFDGDGMVAMFCFPGDGKAPYFANRFVRTEAFVKEQEAGKMIYRGAFSVGNPSGTGFYNPLDLSIKKVANTGVIYWGGRLLALYERDLPYQLTTPDLRTEGPTDCDGAIDGPFFAAHYRVFQEKDGSKRLVGFNSAESGLDNKVTIWEFEESGKQVHKSEAILPDAAFAFLHDIVMTERHYIFLENPIRMNFGKLFTRYMFGTACIAECLQYDASRPTKVHVIPRPGRGAPPGADGHRVYSTPAPFHSFHHSNAWETSEGKIVIDTVALADGFNFASNLSIGAAYYDNNEGRGALTRVVIEPWSGNVTQHKLLDRSCEFPCVAPSLVGRPSTHTYLIGSRFDDPERWGAFELVFKTTIDPELHANKRNSTAAAAEFNAINDDNTTLKNQSSNISKNGVSQKIYRAGADRWCYEPLFIPRPNGTAEDDGWVLVMVFDAITRRSDLIILDAKEMEQVAKIKLPTFLPAGLHGSWNSEYLGPELKDGAQFVSKKYDIRNGASKYE